MDPSNLAEDGFRQTMFRSSRLRHSLSFRSYSPLPPRPVTLGACPAAWKMVVFLLTSMTMRDGEDSSFQSHLA